MKTARELHITKNGMEALLTTRRVLKKLVKKQKVKVTMNVAPEFSPVQTIEAVPFKFTMNWEHVNTRSGQNGKVCGTAGCMLGIVENFHAVPLSDNDKNVLHPLFYPSLRRDGKVIRSNMWTYKGITEAVALETLERFLKTGVIRFKNYDPEERE